MRYVFCLCICFAPLIPAAPPEFVLEEDGFAVIQTFSLMPGKICRKLDRYQSPVPLAWHTRDEWRAIYLAGGTKNDVDNPDKLVGIPAGPCQMGISQRTLVGPLGKGKWQIYGTASSVETKALPFSGAQNINRENGAYNFKVEKPAVVAAMIQAYHNSTGACHEYVSPQFVAVKEQSTAALQVLDVRVADHKRFDTGGIRCRALPQTIGHGALELQPGSYSITGRDVKRVVIYLQK